MTTTFTQVPYPNTLGTAINACANPSFEVSLASWTLSGAGTFQRVYGNAAAGSYFARLTATAVSGNPFIGPSAIPVVAGEVWYVQARLRGTPGRTGQVFSTILPGSTNVIASVTLTGSWQLVLATVTIPAAQTSMVPGIALAAAGVQIGDVLDIDTVSFSKAPGAPFDGSTPPVAGAWSKWNGVPHLSSSTQFRQVANSDAVVTTQDVVLAWEEATQRRMTEHWIIGQPDPVVTVASPSSTLDYRKGTFETWHADEATARAFVQFLYAGCVMVADPARPSAAPYVVIRDATAAPTGDEKRRWSVRASWTEISPNGVA